MSAKKAAEIWGKNNSYVRNSLRQSSEMCPKGTYRIFGKQLVVTTEGMASAIVASDPRKDKHE